MNTFIKKSWSPNPKAGWVFAAALTVLLFMSGRGFWGGAAVGAAGAGAAYEYSNKEQMDRLEEDYRSGSITEQEYRARKKQIEEGSILY